MKEVDVFFSSSSHLFSNSLSLVVMREERRMKM